MAEDEQAVVDLTMSDYSDALENQPTSQATITHADSVSASPDPDSNQEIETASKTLPPIDEQRSIIAQLFNATPIVEGTLLFVIPSVWWNAFLAVEFESTEDAQNKLGVINVDGILKEGDVFCDQNHLPLSAVTENVFNQLREWYGVSNDVGVTTHAIKTDDGQLIPEFAKPMFYLHHLLADNGFSHHLSRYNTSYASIPMFSLSRLNTLGDLVQKSVQVLLHKEGKTLREAANKKYRLWLIRDPNESSLNYQFYTSTFTNINEKASIKKAHMGTTLKDADLTIMHLVIEEKVKNHSESSSTRRSSITKSYWPSDYNYLFPPKPSDGTIGLQNLGNTCYMNSALQCLVHIPELTQYFMYGCYQTELNTDNPLGMDGKVAMSFAHLVSSLFDKKSNRGTSFTPRDFKSTIGYFNSMFSGYHQQDSQEFLAFLLDGLHEDLNRIIKKPITEKPELNGHEDAKNLDKIAELAQKSWEQHKLRNDSVIIDLFVGMYKSTLICPVCDKISITFDPFSDLTLPLPVDEVWSRTINLFLEDGPIKSFEVELNKTATYSQLKQYVAKKLDLNPDHLFTAEVWNSQFYKNFESSESQSGYLPLSELMSDEDNIYMYEVRHTPTDILVPVICTANPPSNTPSAFGVPFIIALSPNDRKSFGSIRQKLEQKVEQLSTFHYFSKVRSNQASKKFTLNDFPLLSRTSDGYESDVSMANPEISGDYAFKIKLFDSSRESKLRNTRRRTQRSTTYGAGGSQSSDDSEDKVWLPNSRNNFTNLPDLLDLLDDKKKSLYTYAKKLDIDSSNESGEISTPASKEGEVIELSSDDEEEEALTEPKETEVDIGTKINDGNSGTSANTDLKMTTSSDDDQSTPEFEIEPLTSSIMFASKATDSPADPPSDLGQVDSPIEPRYLVNAHTALVLEWTPDSFDTFFFGQEGEGEDGKDTWSSPQPIVNEEVEESKKRRASKKNEVLTLDQCLRLFSKPEVLSDQDLWYCSTCKEHRQASKQIQIWNTPDILTIHLKRFQNQRSFSDKIDAVVDFPIEGLDMSPYIASSLVNKDGAIYDLIAVDNHYGGIGGGHYTAYAKNFIDGKWYYYNDSHVSLTDPEKSISGAAYLLFYRRRGCEALGGDKLRQLLATSRAEHDEREKRQRELDEKMYKENIDPDEDDSSDDEAELDGALADSDESLSCDELDVEPEVKHVTAHMIPLESTGADDDSSDNVSIPVGTDDEDDQSAQRRKQRLISRRKGLDRSLLFSDSGMSMQSDLESPAATGPGSPASDDNCSEYSSTVNPPVQPIE